jgi:predicted tellurium resistance membrane protein TerC
VDCRRHDGPWGIAVGAGTAALLLLTFAVIVAPLLAYPYVKLIGGLALIYVAIKLLVQRGAREEAVAAATNLSAVVRIVLRQTSSSASTTSSPSPVSREATSPCSWSASPSRCRSSSQVRPFS